MLQSLVQHSHNPAGQNLCIYGDPAYPIRPQLLGPLNGAHVTHDQNEFNKAMSKVRISVEWIFGDIGKMYIVCALLHNEQYITIF